MLEYVRPLVLHSPNILSVFLFVHTKGKALPGIFFKSYIMRKNTEKYHDKGTTNINVPSYLTQFSRFCVLGYTEKCNL